MRRLTALAAGLLLPALIVAQPSFAEPSLEWSDLYDGGALYVDIGTAALTDPEGNLYVGGECRDEIAGSDMLVRKLLRDDGTTDWTFSYSAYDGNDMALSDMTWDGSGNLLIGGHIRGCET
jgi:hypothetical protein